MGYCCFITGVDCGKPDLFCVERVLLTYSSNASLNSWEEVYPYNHTLYEDTWTVYLHHKWLLAFHTDDTIKELGGQVNLTCNYTGLWNNANLVNCSGMASYSVLFIDSNEDLHSYRIYRI